MAAPTKASQFNLKLVGDTGYKYYQDPSTGEVYAYDLNTAAISPVDKTVWETKKNDLEVPTSATPVPPLPADQIEPELQIDMEGATPQTASTPQTPVATTGIDPDAMKKLQRQQLRRDLGPMALVGGIGSAVQLGQAFMPKTFGNVQDRYAAEQLEELQAREARGQLGLSAGERAEMERQMMDPVRTMARDIQRAGEAERASAGAVTSAAAQVRADRERQRLIADQARQAGAQITQADMAKADQELKKMESLMAYKAQRQQQALANLQQTGMQVAQLAGLSRAGRAMNVVSPDQFALTGITPEQQQNLAYALSRQQYGPGGITNPEAMGAMRYAGITDPQQQTAVLNAMKYPR
jgi:hypothetical protein